MAYDENFILTSIKECLDKSDMPEGDKKYVIVVLWTQEQIPQIESDEQYEEYRQRQKQLEQSLPHRSDPSFDLAWAEFGRSPTGILAESYGARMIEWEEAKAELEDDAAADDDDEAKREEIEQRLRAQFEQNLEKQIDDQIEHEREDAMLKWEEERAEALEEQLTEAFEESLGDEIEAALEREREETD